MCLWHKWAARLATSSSAENIYFLWKNRIKESIYRMMRYYKNYKREYLSWQNLIIKREREFDLNMEEKVRTVKAFRRKAVLTDVMLVATLVCAAALVGPGRHARWGLYAFFAFPILLLLDLLLYFLTFRRCPSCGRAFWHTGQWAARPFVWRWTRCPDCGFSPPSGSIARSRHPSHRAHRGCGACGPGLETAAHDPAGLHGGHHFDRSDRIRAPEPSGEPCFADTGRGRPDRGPAAPDLPGPLPRLRRLAAPAQKCLGLLLQPMRIPDRLIVRVHADAPSARCEGSIS